MRVEAVAVHVLLDPRHRGVAAYRIAIGDPSVTLSFVLLLFVVVDVIIWRKWRDLA